MAKKEIIAPQEEYLFKEFLPGNDRSILIFSERYFGPDVWHAACWLGEDDGEAGEFCWTIDGAAYTKKEIGATHWREMPATPAKKKYRKKPLTVIAVKPKK